MTPRLRLLLASAIFLHAQQPDPGLPLMPWPAQVAIGDGHLTIHVPLRIALTACVDPRVENTARTLGEIIDSESSASLIIQCDGPSASVQQLAEDESYRLEIRAEKVHLTAANPLGALRGLATFRQILIPTLHGFEAPLVDIHDHPRFPWRGLHLDVARHWMPIEVVLRNLDGMAAVKLNVFHWHLSDDQGFRVESKLYPQLQQLGSDGHFYTQDEVRRVIAYARDRGIRVVPEFDVPGHTTSWLAAYPQLASAPGPYSIERNWGVFDPTMDPTRESTYQFLDRFIGEMSTLFPDVFFHIGGDEVTGKQWNRSLRIRAFMRKNRLKTTTELQAYFTRRLQTIVARHGKRMEGWDEILDPNLPHDVVIQSWRGQKSLAASAQQGFAGLLSAGYYLDHIEPASILYAVDPLSGDAAMLSDQAKSRILGGEVAMWGEFVSAENVDSRIWPRDAAVAERLWSPNAVTNAAAMYRRLDRVSRQLSDIGLTHRTNYLSMLNRLAAGRPMAPLQTLADVIEPATFGQRIRTHTYTQLTPLDRLVDAARPDSDVARDFARQVDQMNHDQIRLSLTHWRDNDALLKPTLEASPLLQEDIPVSAALSRLAVVGLQALDNLEHKQRPPAAWLTREHAFLASLKNPIAELRIAIVASIEKLVNASAQSR